MMSTLAFLSGVGFQELILLLLFPVLFVGILLILRVFFLWYWKVNIIIKNQEVQIRLLSDLVAQNRPAKAKIEPAAGTPGIAGQ